MDISPEGPPLTLAAILLAGFGGLIAAIKFGLSRVAKSFEDMSGSFTSMAAEHKATRETLVRVETVVQEGRDDISEIRRIAERVGPPERPSRRDIRRDPSLRVARRPEKP